MTSINGMGFHLWSTNTIKSMSAVIEQLFKKLDHREVQYCVLRNFRSLYEGDIEGDIDVLVSVEDRQTVVEIFSNLNWQKRTGDTSHQTRFTTICLDRQSAVVFDFYWGTATYNGLPLVDGERILENRRQYKNIWIPSQEDYFVELVFHSVLNKNGVPKRYRDELQRLTGRVNRTIIDLHATELFGSAGKTAVDAALDGEYDELPVLKPKLVASGLWRSPSSIWSLLFNLFVLRKIIRPMKRLGEKLNPLSGVPVLAVIGPDGVGKSTAVAGVAERLEAEGIDATTKTMGVHSGGSRFLRTVRSVYNRLVGWEPQTEAIEAGTATLGSRSSEPRAVALFVDFLIRYIQVQRSGADVVIADRYLHELVVYAHASQLRHLFPIIEPARFFGVVLDGDPSEVADRSEFDHESVVEFYRRLEDVRWKRIDTDGGPEVTTEALLTIAMALIGERT